MGKFLFPPIPFLYFFSNLIFILILYYLLIFLQVAAAGIEQGSGNAETWV